MYLLVTATVGTPAISLEAPDDCNRFHVAIRGLSQETQNGRSKLKA